MGVFPSGTSWVWIRLLTQAYQDSHLSDYAPEVPFNDYQLADQDGAFTNWS
jgi:hypothetical protein